MQKETVQQRKMLSPASALRLIVVWMSAVAEVRQAAVLEVAPEDLDRGSYGKEARYAMRVASVLLGLQWLFNRPKGDKCHDCRCHHGSGEEERSSGTASQIPQQARHRLHHRHPEIVDGVKKS
jgi:hypothetical protein